MSQVPAKPIVLTPQTARRLAIAKQHLAGPLPRRPGAEAIMSLMEDMRYVQLDPTSVVAPSHLIVLWSRLGGFRPPDLDGLMWKDKKLLENWGHRASLVLTEDYPFFLARSRRFFSGDGLWPRRLREWMSANEDVR